jgi:hypothetical protein
MIRSPKQVSVRGPLLLPAVILNAIILEKGMTENAAFYWLLLVTVPVVILAANWFRVHNRK